MGEQIKFGPFEGDSDALISIAGDSNLKEFLHQYKKPRIKFLHFAFLLILYIVFLLIVWVYGAEMATGLMKTFIVLCLASGFGMVIAAHLYFKNVLVSITALFFLSLMFAMCINLLTPKDVGENLLKKAEKATNTILNDSLPSHN